MSKPHCPICYTVLCILRNWQKKNWKLGFQSDSVTVFKENLVFNMRYHVKLLVLGIKSTVEVECHLLKGTSMIRTYEKPDTVWYVPHFMHI